MKNSKYWLALFNSNLDNEIDICGFKLFRDREKEEYIAAFSKCERNIHFSIESNESIKYKDGKDLLSNIQWKPIDAEEFIFVIEMFSDEYAYFPDIYLTEEEREENEK